MNRDRTDDPALTLMLAVDVLTAEHTVVVEAPGGGRVLGTRNEHALLMKLRAAKAGNVGKGGGAGSPGRERSPLNVGAADLYDRLAGVIAELFKAAAPKAQVLALPENNLRQWMLYYLNQWRAGEMSHGSMRRRIGEVQSWVQQIRDLLDPPFRYPINRPCPNCGEQWAEVFHPDNPTEVERELVLNCVERENPEESYIMCSACSAVWAGVYEARMLSIALDAGDNLAKEK